MIDGLANRGIVDPPSWRENRQPLHHVLQLADVARPAILFHRLESRIGQLGIELVPLVIALQKIMDQ